jgi:hypothetical protein
VGVKVGVVVIAVLTLTSGCSGDGPAKLLALERGTGAVTWERNLPTQAADAIWLAHGQVHVAACAPPAHLVLDPSSGDVLQTGGYSGYPSDDGSGRSSIGSAVAGVGAFVEVWWSQGSLSSSRGWSRAATNHGAAVQIAALDDTVFVLLNGGKCDPRD